MNTNCKILLIFTSIFVNLVFCENKYSEAANTKKYNEVNFRTLQKPFRMAKLNLLWSKAQQRLTEPKLQSLYSELKIQDKEELSFKRVKSEGGDKEGLKEAELRTKLLATMKNYNLLEHFEDLQDAGRVKDHIMYTDDKHLNKALFKDKKLNLLWQKAEVAGFTPEELFALREEFTHHQDKIEEYYSLLNKVDNPKKDYLGNVLNEEEIDKFNDINFQLDREEANVDKNYLHNSNLVRQSHNELRDGYDRLQRLTAQGANSKDFIEPKVQGLWRIASQANFTSGELESLRVELQHYESRLQKLRHLNAEHLSNLEKYKSKFAAPGDKFDHFEETQHLIKKQQLKVQRLHEDIEAKISQRHPEL